MPRQRSRPNANMEVRDYEKLIGAWMASGPNSTCEAKVGKFIKDLRAVTPCSMNRVKDLLVLLLDNGHAS
eukprot:14502389-Alexandrium_andersonii.AAC.1